VLCCPTSLGEPGEIRAISVVEYGQERRESHVPSTLFVFLEGITEEINEQPGQKRIVVVSTRVSANENRPNLDAQAERLCAYCGAKGWKVVKVVKEVGSGVNDGRKKLLALLADPTVTVIVVEHKDRLTRFGFKYIETLLAMQGRSIEVVNVTENPIEDIIADCVSILYSFCAKRYGQRRAKRKTEKIVQDLNVKAEQKKAHEEVKEKSA